MKRLTMSRGNCRLRAGSTGLARRIIGRFGDGRGWIGLAGSGRTATRTGALVREVVELRREPKYLPHNRWHIERWMPPESYGSPEQWHAETLEIENGRSIAALGPYPSRGDYEHCFTLEGPRGEFVQLTPAAARHIARAIEASRGAARVEEQGSARGADAARGTRV